MTHNGITISESAVVSLKRIPRLTPQIYIALYSCLISGFRREVAENCALVGHYAASSGNVLLMLRNKLSVPSSVVWNPKEAFLLDSRPLKMRPTVCSETSIRNYDYSLRNNTEEHSSLHLIHFMIFQILLFRAVSPQRVPSTKIPVHSESFIYIYIHIYRY